MIRKVYKYADRLLDYLEDIKTIYISEFKLNLLANFYHLTLILPLSILISKVDICEKYIISIKFIVKNKMNLFILKKNK